MWYWILLLYLVVAFIIMGFSIDMEKEDKIREAFISSIVGLLWPAVILLGVGIALKKSYEADEPTKHD